MIIKAKKIKHALKDSEKCAEKMCKFSPVWKCDYSAKSVLYDSKQMKNTLFDMDCSGSISAPLVKIAIIVAVCTLAMSAVMIYSENRCMSKMLKKKCKCKNN